jgi:hypothetical protein
MSHPRVLHVGFNPIGSPTNTGLTLSSMFGSWPSDRLFELYMMSRQTAGASRPNVLLAPPMVAPVDGAIRRLVGSRMPSPASDGMNNSVQGRASSLPFRYRLRAAASTLNDVGPVVVRGGWTAPLQDFRPQVIHSLLGGVRVMKLVARMSKLLDVPVVPHFMDDWPANLFADGKLLGLPRAEVERSMAEVMRRSPLCLAIGDDMRAEFAARFNTPCLVVGNSVDFDAFTSPPAPVSEHQTFTYVGGLHLGRDVMLGRVAEALAASPGSTLRIHSPASDNARAEALAQRYPSVVSLGGTVDPSQVPGVLVASDVLVFVESLEPHIFSFTRLSVSTKVPEYLAARRPVLALGPADQSSIRTLRMSGAAVHSSGEAPHDVAQAVQKVQRLSRRPLGPLPPELRETFDVSLTQDRLRAAMEAAVRSGRP